MDLREAIKTLDPAIVQIQVRHGGLDFTTLGTGFLINEDAYGITAKHVVDAAGGGSLMVGLAHQNTENMRSNFTLTDLNIVAEDARHDLALFQLSQNPFRGEIGTGIRIGDQDLALPIAAVTWSDDRPRDGEEVAVSGYPLSQATLITNAGHIASRWGYEEAQVPDPRGFPTVDLADTYIADIQVNPGNSGGPTYIVESGLVAGVCVANLPAPVFKIGGNGSELATVEGEPLVHNSGLAVIVPSPYVKELVESNHIEWRA